jgi:hypothetical protein
MLQGASVGALVGFARARASLLMQRSQVVIDKPVLGYAVRDIDKFFVNSPEAKRLIIEDYNASVVGSGNSGASIPEIVAS